MVGYAFPGATAHEKSIDKHQETQHSPFLWTVYGKVVRLIKLYYFTDVTGLLLIFTCTLSKNETLSLQIHIRSFWSLSPRSSNSTDSIYLLFSIREKGFVFYFDAPLTIGVDAKDKYPLFSKRE